MTYIPARKLYYHQTDGGAEYLTDAFILCPNGHKEGTIEGATISVRIDGDIRKDAQYRVYPTTFPTPTEGGDTPLRSPGRRRSLLALPPPTW